jgi:hypothetical protein
LVDYNETLLKTKPAAKARTRRGRRSGGGKATPNTQDAAATKAPVEAKNTENTSDEKE